jgi:hypothetical protein
VQDLIEQNKEANGLSFQGEIKELEFTENIGGMDKNICVDKDKRDKELINIGKKLFKRPLVRLNKIFKIMILNNAKFLSQEEIDGLLTANNRDNDKTKRLYTRSLVIYFCGKEYRIGFSSKKLIHQNHETSTESNKREVLSEKEISVLLEELKNDLDSSNSCGS